MHKQTVVAFLICLVLLALIIPGCSDKHETYQNIVTTVYYDDLNKGKYVELPAAAPQFPASGELYSENTSIFRLVAASAGSLQKALPKAMLSDFALYAPPAATSKQLALAISDTSSSTAAFSGSAIPSLKKQDSIPASCAGLSGVNLRNCLDDLNVGSVPQSDHVSAHDPQSLAIELGRLITDSIPGKTVQALTSHVSKADRDTIVAKLTDFTNDDPAYATIDMAAFDPFGPNGYSLASVVISDSSMSDINGDGILEPHSTMITEIVKPLNYRRSPSAALDSCVTKYGNSIEDRYVAKVTTYLHLDDLKAQRQTIPVFTPTTANPVAPANFYESIHSARAINHALDANIIKAIYASPATLPGSSTEYTFMFQIAPEQINGEYKDLLVKIADAGDTACQEVVEQHVNPRTAIISGMSPAGRALAKGSPPLTVFYQVPAPFSRQLTAKIASALTGQTEIVSADSEPVRDYCMVDQDGRKVAIVDPVSGAVVPACEKFNQQAMAKTVLMTKTGACKNDHREQWAYDASRVRTDRFGRGIQWILTEWLLHNQVGDYKNIHWYQSAWKSGAQIAIKAAKYLLATYLKIQIGAIKIEADDKEAAVYLKSLLPLIADIVMKMDGTKIAGYSLSMPASVGSFLSRSSSSGFGDQTFDYWLIMDMKDGVKSYVVDRVTDAAAQMLDVTVTGWQDISDRSHYGCFEFSY